MHNQSVMGAVLKRLLPKWNVDIIFDHTTIVPIVIAQTPLPMFSSPEETLEQLFPSVPMRRNVTITKQIRGRRFTSSLPTKTKMRGRR